MSVGEFCVRDSFEFAKEISDFENKGYTMASFDVCSLFTNIPVKETCDIILDKLFPNFDSKFENFDKTSFKKVLDICTKDNIFLFNGKMYKQIEGAPMGGCCSPTLANIFLNHYEKLWLDSCPEEFKPVYYRRYVDDTFLLFRHVDHISKFHDYINSKHRDIKFTYEVEVDEKLSFLDVLVGKENSVFLTDVFRKPSSTGLGMKFDSAISFKYKINLINCLLDRAYKISSTSLSFTNEIQKLKTFFGQNNFPNDLVERVVNRNLINIFSPRSINAEVSKKVIYASIPFMSRNLNRSVHSDIQELARRFYPQINLRLSFKNSFTVNSFFPFKDHIPFSVRSNVVYSYTCEQCFAQYYGETKRHIKTRIAEHRGLSARTGIPVLNPSHSNIRSHVLDTGHEINPKNFKIIHSNTSANLRVSESILIHRFKPCLNQNI